jgi:hypothetical protein
MKNKNLSRTKPSQTQSSSSETHSNTPPVLRRRSFLKGLGITGATFLSANALLMTEGKGQATLGGGLTKGDVAILRLLAAAEIIEADLWQQYNELGGVGATGSISQPYITDLQVLDGDMPQYIADNTDDEISHMQFLNGYLKSKGEDQINLDHFRTLPSSQAQGAQNVGRLTNLRNLTVDTSFYTRYRSKQNPDFGATFPQALTIQGQPAIPLNDTETPPNMAQPIPPTTVPARRMQAIANTAGFHFGYIEQGGASLYNVMSGKCTSLEVLRIVVSIGGVEIDHFGLWHDKMGNAVSQPLAGVIDPETGLKFPDLNAPPFGGEEFQTNLILPEPCEFISPNLPLCSVIRPSLTQFGGAVATIKSFTADHLFDGQSPEFFETVMALAMAADAAERQLEKD